MESRLDRFEYTVDELVIGGTLEALLYAWFTGATVICTNPTEPFFFERFTPEAKLDRIGLENKLTTLNSPKGSKIFGPKKSEIWRRLFMLLSMAGQAPITSTAQSVRLESGVVKVTTSHSRLARFRYKKVKIFDPSEIDAIQRNRGDHRYMVLDWMKVDTGKVHPYEFLNDEEDFINNFNFNLMSTPNDWDLIFIGSGCNLRVPKSRRITGKIAYKKEHPASKCVDSYLINYSASDKIYNTIIPFTLPIDFEINHHMRVHDMTVYWWEPPVITQGSQCGLYESEIVK